MVVLGTEIRTPITHPSTDIVSDDASLRRGVATPWGRAFLAKRLGMPLTTPTLLRPVILTPELLDRHSLIVGASGSGKTRAFEHIVSEQVSHGVSVLILDPKFDTITSYLARFRRMGLKPEQITCLVPRFTVVPGWNPLCGDVPVEQAVTAFVALLAKSSTSWGPRMQDLLVNACLVIASHGLSIYELVRFLLNDTYRSALLERTPTTLDPLTYGAAREYFAEEFDQWSKLAQTQAVAPITNKLREFLRNPFLRALTCPLTSTLLLSQLWREHQIVLVHLDESLLGAEATRLLAGMLANSLFQTAMRTEGKHKVLLVLDELASLEKFMGTAISDIVTVARSRGLRLMVACQHLAQLSDTLCAALLANCACQVFFRVGSADSRLIGSSLAVTTEPWLKRIGVDLVSKPKPGEPLPLTTWAHSILDAGGQTLSANATAWATLQRSPSWTHDPLQAFGQLARQCGKGRLYVQAADTGRAVELVQYARGVEAEMLQITGPTPLRLVVSFPHLKASSVERVSEAELAREWAKQLLAMPIQHCAVRLMGGRPQIIKVINVASAEPSPDQDDFVGAALAANCQTKTHMQEALCARKAAVERLAGTTFPQAEQDDGSLF